ncbi:MAG: hypothetical protein AAGD13_25435 [Pseudomonadota bacterium]
MLLILSLIALALGPILYGVFRGMGPVRRSLDGFLFVAIAGIVIVHIVPEVFEIAGYQAIAFLVLGIGFAFGVERHPVVASGGRYAWVVMFGALGLVLHAAMDGIALLPGELSHGHDHHSHGALPSFAPTPTHAEPHTHDEGLGALLTNHLALGVILHRIPVGMAIWWTLRPVMGSAVAVGALALIALATSAAYLFGEPVIDLMQSGAIASFQAFVAGSLLHVIVFSSIRQNTEASGTQRSLNALGERLGILAGLCLVFLVPHAH